MERYFDNAYAEFWVDKGILFFVYRPNGLLDLNMAHTIVADRLRFQGERAYPIFCDIRNITDSSKDARDYLAREGSTMAKTVALLVAPPVTHVMSQFYVRTSRPLAPTRIFDDAAEALAYLRGFVP